ncbi:flavin-containing monooxygenase FMO GS-OX5-like [Rutidosis leptorrhynchoides]|uniref:flavin-containing monooxygenase FMO GS-OX5-like n=1 Tax=Rutidosis leptorrhynchoides TaxID=125765 RepID=UPI003A99D4DC
MSISLKVAVIGAGVSGLIAARELQRESHHVEIFEQSHRLGGTWAYDPQTESDLLGLDPNRDIVYGSCYKSLQTNLPRELMSFTDFKFGEKVYGDPRMFPGHEEVLKYVEDFASHFELVELIRFNTLVTRVKIIDSESTEFVVESCTSGVSSEEVFDAVVVCSGHNSEPNLPTDIPGIETWSKKQLHSHNYRVPDPFKDQIVLVIGSGPSGLDMSKEIATVAKQVHMSSRSNYFNPSELEKLNNLWMHAKIQCINNDGTVTFEDGFTVEADVILYCTGYKYHVPFLEANGIVSSHGKRVGPLYKHVFPPQLAPRLSFVGIPERSIIIPLVEGQSKWIANLLSRKVSLLSEDEMLSEVKEHYREMKEKGISERRTHSLDFKIDYLEWIYAQSGMVVEKRTKDIYDDFINLILSGSYDYKHELTQKYRT